ncbi:hypothetical protein [Sulfolobus spindle-shaped virus 6]|uniref:Uncharacterized protein n=1 Tax=Sulfolobus spindle-shaped virus 6 TaxID=693627 RepID=D1GF31_9VIRU|nr:hypothetical protein SSSV6_gp13 [Sulfolobus spindle-shaped virus 6]ACZ35733.1 hypothetical protein [Sulfolobus spindle-shaped virus 6]
MKHNKTNVVEMFKFVKENKEMDWKGFYWWLKENDFQQMNHVWNKFNDGDVWHNETFENLEFRIDIKYLEKKGGIIKFLNVDIKRIGGGKNNEYK